MDIIKKLAQELTIKEEQAKAAVQLIDEGNTIPFIARYRKEMTGALNDEMCIRDRIYSSKPISYISSGSLIRYTSK